MGKDILAQSVKNKNYIFLIFPSIISTLLELTIHFSMADDFFPRCEIAKYFLKEMYVTEQTRTKPLLVTSPSLRLAELPLP